MHSVLSMPSIRSILRINSVLRNSVLRKNCILKTISFDTYIYKKEINRPTDLI